MLSHQSRVSALRRILVATVFVMVGLSGCYSLFGSRRPGDSGLATKRVVRKEPPTSLWAMDNTRCLVTAEKYQHTTIGTEVTCYWEGSAQNRPVIAGDDRSSAAKSRGDAEVSGKTDDMRVRSTGGKKPKESSPH